MYAASVLRAQLEESDQRGCFPYDLLTTDRILQRWAVSIGSGLPTEVWDDTPVAKPPPLPDDLAILVDRTVLKAPRRKGLVVRLWYRTPCPAGVIARRLNCSVRGLYLEVNASLHYMRGCFVRSGNRQLQGLVGDRLG